MASSSPWGPLSFSWFRQGIVLVRQNRIPAAADKFRQVLKHQPKSNSTRWWLAQCYHRLGKTPEALAQLGWVRDLEGTSLLGRRASRALRQLGLPDLEPQPDYLNSETIDAWHQPESRERLRHLPPEILLRGSEGPKVTALTFDDAPSEATEETLATLGRYGIRATFFVIGRNAADHPAWVRQIVRQGHQLGNHTYSHLNLPSRPLGQAADQLLLTEKLLQSLTGQGTGLFRPPGGNIDPRTAYLARAMGLRTVLWSINSADYRATPEVSLDIVRSRLRPGSIILLHDRSQTARVLLPALIDYLRQEGYGFVTIRELESLGSRYAH